MCCNGLLSAKRPGINTEERAQQTLDCAGFSQHIQLKSGLAKAALITSLLKESQDDMPAQVGPWRPQGMKGGTQIPSPGQSRKCNVKIPQLPSHKLVRVFVYNF